MSVTISGTDGITASGGLYAQTAFTGTFTDGIVVDYTTGAGRISVGASDGIKFYNGGVANTSLMELTSGGNLGLGVTPSAWTTANAMKVLDVSSTGAVGSDGGATFMTRNAYYNGSNWIYKTSSYAGHYALNSSGQFVWYTAPSGTAGGTVSLTQAMTLDASGKLGIGATTTNGYLTIKNTNPSTNLISIQSYANTGEIASVKFDQATDVWSFTNQVSSGSIAFVTNSTERARIDSSGNLLVGTTSTTPTSGGLVSQIAGGQSYFSIGHVSGTGSGSYYLPFYYNGSIIGGVTQNGTTAVAYNTSSDYRLKHDIAPMTGALAKVVALKPCTYKWNADNSEGEGFIAHELAEVCPHAVTGEKDAVDEDGNPKYQGIDTSFLVATLTAAIQEQQAIIESLKTRIETLEGKA